MGDPRAVPFRGGAKWRAVGRQPGDRGAGSAVRRRGPGGRARRRHRDPGAGVVHRAGLGDEDALVVGPGPSSGATTSPWISGWASSGWCCWSWASGPARAGRFPACWARPRLPRPGPAGVVGAGRRDRRALLEDGSRPRRPGGLAAPRAGVGQRAGRAAGQIVGFGGRNGDDTGHLGHDGGVSRGIKTVGGWFQPTSWD